MDRLLRAKYQDRQKQQEELMKLPGRQVNPLGCLPSSYRCRSLSCSTSSVVSARTPTSSRWNKEPHNRTLLHPTCYLPLPCWRFRITAKPGTTAALDDADSSCGFHGVSPLFSGRTLHVLDNFQLGYAYSELLIYNHGPGKKVPVAPDKEKAGAQAQPSSKRSRSLSQGRIRGRR